MNENNENNGLNDKIVPIVLPIIFTNSVSLILKQMGNDGTGECSQRTDNDNIKEEGTGDTERPLKKARYVWQVKGKYHLKDDVNNADKESPECSKESPSGSSKDTKKDELNNNNCCKDNNDKCSGRCYAESLIEQADMIMAHEDTSDEEYPPNNIEKSISDEIPVTLVTSNQKNQDYYLRKWQARQAAKGYMDNTINRVLETCRVAPFDASDLIENCENDGQVEDEGILMAIQSHGLQPGVPEWNGPRCNEEHSESNPASVVTSIEEIEESTLDNFQNTYNELLKKQLKDDENENEKEKEEEQKTLENVGMGDHNNFLDAAVSFAIQEKGLSSQTFA